jgi:outer membrane protein assembly factor BamB
MAENTFASPAIVQLNGQDQLVITGMDRVDSYNPATGEQLWSSPGTAKATCGTVVASQDRLFASGGFPGKQTVCVDGTGQLLWSNRDRLYEPSLIVVGDHLYGVSDDGIAMCWSSADGSQRWRQRLSGKFSASPIVCNGILYVSNLSGETYVFRANPNFYDELAINTLGNDCYTSAAVKESQLFLRIGVRQGDKRQEQLVCLQESADK